MKLNSLKAFGINFIIFATSLRLLLISHKINKGRWKIVGVLMYRRRSFTVAMIIALSRDSALFYVKV